MPHCRQSALGAVAIALLVACDVPAEPTTEATSRAASAAVGSLDGTLDVTAAGTLRYTIPLLVAPGRVGIEPDLALVYDSSQGTGLLGVGWSLSGLSRIHRCRANVDQDGRVVARTFDDDDRLCVDGDRLWPQPAGDELYRREHDDFSSYRRSGSTTNPESWFEVRAADGRILTYGGTADSNLTIRGAVQSWSLRRIEDRDGNYLTVTYGYEPAQSLVYGLGLVASYDNHRPQAIDYTGHGAMAPRRRVEFFYQKRPESDSILYFLGGGRMTTTVRLERIDSRGPDGELVRSYQLGYSNHDKNGGRSVIEAIRECAGDGACKPPTRFDYVPTSGLMRWESQAWDGASYSLDGDDADGVRDLRVLDANGDGRDDLAVRGGDTWRLMLSRGAGDGPGFEASELGDATDFALAGDFHYAGDGADALARIDLPDDPEVFDLDVAVGDFDGDGRLDRMWCHAEVSLEECEFPDPDADDGGDDDGGGGGGGEDDPADEDEGPDPDPDDDPEGDDDGADDDPQGDGGGVCPHRAAHWVFDQQTLLGFNRHDTEIPCAEVSADGHLSDQAAWITVDHDGDGTMNLLVVDGSTYTAVIFDGDTWSEEETDLPTDVFQRRATSATGPGLDRIMDVNGDGLGDLVRYEPDPSELDWDDVAGHACDDADGDEPFKGIARAWLNTGAGFAPGPVLATFKRRDSVCTEFTGSAPLDYDSDGRVDLLIGYRAPPDPAEADVYWVALSLVPAPSILRPTSLSIGDIDARIVQLDLLGNGQHGLALWDDGEWRLYVRSVVPNLLRDVTDGFGAHTSIRYAAMSDPEVYEQPSPCLPDEPDDDDEWLQRVFFRCVPDGRALVAEVERDTGVAAEPHIATYHYDTSLTHVGRGSWLGFEARRVDERHGAGPIFRTSTTSYGPRHAVDHPDHLYWVVPYAFQPMSSSVTTRMADTDLQVRIREDNTYELQVTAANTWSAYVRVNEAMTTETIADCNLEDGCPGSTILNTTETTVLRDDFGNTTHRAVERDGYRTVEISTFDNHVEPWLLGLERTRRVESYAPLAPVQVRETAFTYDGNGALETETVEPGQPLLRRHTYFERDPYGNITTTEVDAASGLGGDEVQRSADVTYDADERIFPVLTKDGEGQVATTTWRRGDGVPLISESEAAVRTHVDYDGFGRPIATWRSASAGQAEGGTRLIRYERIDAPLQLDAPSRLRMVETVTGGTATVVEHDRQGREAYRQWLGFGGVPRYVRTGYAASGQVDSRSVPAVVGVNPTGYWHTTHDELGRPISKSEPGGGTTTTSYVGLEQETTDANDHTTRTRVDAHGRRKWVRDPLGTTLCFYYGPFDALTSTWVNVPGRCDQAVAPVDRPPPTADAYVIEQVSDAYGHVVREDDPDQGRLDAYYNGFGELRAVRDAEDRIALYERDRVGRLIRRIDTQGVVGLGKTTWEWGASAGWGAPAQLRRSVSPDGIERLYQYDAFARPTRVRTLVAGLTLDVLSSYDAHARPWITTYPSGGTGFAVRNEYDAWGNLVAVRNNATNAEFWRLQATTPFDAPTLERAGNGLRTISGYDSIRLTSLRTGTAGAPTLVQDLRFERDLVGNLTDRHDDRLGLHEDYGYDPLDRLVGVRTTFRFGDQDVELGDDAITYGPLGTIEHRTGIGDYTYGGEHPTAVQSAAGVDFEYDATGNVIERGASSFEYTPYGKPWRITSPGEVIAISHDADQQRIRRRTTGGAVTDTIYIDGLYERTATGAVATVTHHYNVIAGGRVVARVRRSPGLGGQVETVRYVHEDQLGSGDTVTSVAGNVVQRSRFDAWGATHPFAAALDPGVPYGDPERINVGFTGHDVQLDGGLIHMRGRMYDPLLARFASPDPLRHEAGFTQSYDRFAYVFNNPLTFTDPSGYAPEDRHIVFEDADPVPGMVPTNTDDAWTAVERAYLGTEPSVEVAQEHADDPFEGGDPDRAAGSHESLYEAPDLRTSWECPACHPGSNGIDPRIMIGQAERVWNFTEAVVSAVLAPPDGVELSLVAAGVRQGGGRGAVVGGMAAAAKRSKRIRKAHKAALKAWDAAEDWSEHVMANSYRSTKTQFLYAILGPSGELLKYGTTWNMATRYGSKLEALFGSGARMIELSRGNARWIRASERSLILRHMDLNRSAKFPDGVRPPFNYSNH